VDKSVGKLHRSAENPRQLSLSGRLPAFSPKKSFNKSMGYETPYQLADNLDVHCVITDSCA
jgi:hypothetical protein